MTDGTSQWDGLPDGTDQCYSGNLFSPTNNLTVPSYASTSVNLLITIIIEFRYFNDVSFIKNNKQGKFNFTIT